MYFETLLPLQIVLEQEKKGKKGRAESAEEPQMEAAESVTEESATAAAEKLAAANDEHAGRWKVFHSS